MKPFDPAFARRLRRRVRDELKRDPLVWRDVPRARRMPRQDELFAFFFPLIILGMFVLSGKPVVVFFGLAVWTLGSTMHYARELQTFLIEKAGLTPFYTQPASREFVYAYCRRQFLRGSITTFVTAAGAFSLLAWTLHLGWMGFVWAIVCGALVWTTSVAFSVILFRHWRTARFGVYGILLSTGFVILVFFIGDSWRAVLVETAESVYPVLRYCTPGGWVCGIAEWGLGISSQPPLLGALLAAAVIGYAMVAERKLRESFVFFEGDLGIADPEDEMQAGAIGEEPLDRPGASVSTDAKTGEETVEAIRNALQPAIAESGGMLKGLILYGFTRRELAVADFLLGEPPSWSRRYRRGAVILLVLIGLFHAISAMDWQLLTRTGAGWIYWITAAVGILHMTPIFTGIWRGLETGSVGNRTVAFLSMLPVGIGETRRIILRINRRRLLLASPWIVAVIYTYARLYITPQESVGLALVGVAILWSIIPVGMITQFSSTTDERGTAFWFKALVVVALLLLAASGLSAIFTLLLGKVTAAAVLTLIFAAVTHGMYAVYFHRYRMMHFDIMAPRQG